MFRRSTIAAACFALVASGAICISATNANAGSFSFHVGVPYYGGHGVVPSKPKKPQQQSSTMETSKTKKKSKAK